MKILIGVWPPNRAKIDAAFNNPRAVFCYGDTIFNPYELVVDAGLLAHEATHCIQQGKDPEKWWDSYIQSTAFRLAQEVPAFQVQYKETKRFIKDRNRRSNALSLLAKELSGSLYGEMISYSEAYKAIERDELFYFTS